MFELFLFFYILSIIISLILSWKFNFLTKKEPEKYKKLLNKIKEKETNDENDENDLNLFKNNKSAQNFFIFLLFMFFPFVNLLLCYILLNNINFLNNKK